MSVGQSLAAARAERGMTVDELAAGTRIRGTLIRAIEADDFSMCGGDVYARGHIRSIARVLGVDGEQFVTEFDATHPRETIDHTVESIGAEWKPKGRERPRPAWGAAMGVAVLLLICGIVILGQLKPHKGATASNGIPTTSAPAPTTTPPPVTSSPASSPAASSSTTSPATVATDSAVAQARRDGVNLRLRVTGAQCWVSVTDSTGKQVAMTLHQGDVRDFTDKKQLSLVIGNAGAITIINNGTELPPLGKTGAVVHRTFSATSPTASAG